MGIKGLIPFLRKRAPRAFQYKYLRQYAHTVVGVDTSLFLYQYCIAMKGARRYDVNDDNAHIHGLFNRTITYLQHRVHPIFVFDGPPSSMKCTHTLPQRADRQKLADDRLATLHSRIQKGEEVSDAEVIQQEKRKVRIGRAEVWDCMQLLDLMGLPYVKSEHEAEASCALLNRTGVTDFTATEDTDGLAFGSQAIVRNLSTNPNRYGKAVRNMLDALAEEGYHTPARKNTRIPPVEEITLSAILQELDLTAEQFVDFCVLCGCDYHEGVAGIGPVRAYNHIRRHHNIENVLEALDFEKHPPSPSFLENYASSRQLFLHETHPCPPKVTRTCNTPDYEGLHDYLRTQHRVNARKVTTGVEALRKFYSDGVTVYDSLPCVVAAGDDGDDLWWGPPEDLPPRQHYASSPPVPSASDSDDEFDPFMA